MNKKLSATKLIRSVGNSIEKNLSPEYNKSKKEKKKEHFVNVTIFTHHTTKSQI
jgi:uncharacterized protein YlbG (UPF0298 family)